MPPEQNEQSRREIIRGLEQRDLQLKTRAAEIEKERLALETEAEALQRALLRAYHQPLSNEICLACWIEHGDEVVMRNVPAQPVRPMEDRFVCSRCGREEIRKA